MSVKNKNQDDIEIEGELLNYVSYANCYLRQQLFTLFKVFNRGEENLTVTVKISGSTPLIVPQTVEAEVPHESSVGLFPKNLLNPGYLAELSAPEECGTEVKVSVGKTEVCNLTASVTALPIDYWSGLGGNPEMLSVFVRPKLADCQKILAEAGLQLKTWGYSSEFSGYAGNDKNGIRSAAAAVFSAIRNLNIEKTEGADLSGVNSAGDISRIIGERAASPIELALFAASCLEAVRLHPVILLGKKAVGLGVWLYESCFSNPVQDDMQLIEKYLEPGVNNLSLIDADDLFAHKNASYTTSESHLLSRLQKGAFEACVDIRRCRIGGLLPLPIKVKTSSGYELLGEEQFSYEQKPENILDFSGYEYDSASKDKNWQRRLLDLSVKNNLLNFRYGRDALKVRAGALAEFCQNLESRPEYTVYSDASLKGDGKNFGSKEGAMSELLAMEMKDGKLRVSASDAAAAEICASLIRKARASEEEAGFGSLFMAFGFLKWKYEDEKEEKYAPLCLLPVEIRRKKTREFTVKRGEGYELNTTLAEFLFRQFGVDVRGLDGKGLSPAEIITAFRQKTADLKGWQVYEDVYIAQFTFARYAMWADVKENAEKYRSNPLIESLITNTNQIHGRLEGASEDDSNPAEILTPLPCDSAQFEAVAESAKGTTFVLHGPPGTGKSQTITNMIANAVDAGKRVLFVAEKQAALQVVKKRLSEVGIGDFCLELHSGKSLDKSDIIRGIENTLALKDGECEEGFERTAASVFEMREKLRAPYVALHKKRRLGLSIYEGMVYYLQNKNAPDMLNIETTFYDGLTRAKLEEYELMLSTAQAAANECGGVYRSPFDEVNLTFCDKKVKTSVLCAAEVVLAELKHLKNYLGLLLETFNQKVSKFTAKKLQNSIRIAKILQSDELKEFFSCDEEEFYRFYNANLRYDKEVRHWLKRFRDLPDISRYAADIESELDNWGENYRSSRILLKVIKQINRCGREPVPESEETEWIKRANEIEKARSMIVSNTRLSQKFYGFGGINDKKRAEFLAPLYSLHELCAQTFMDYNADAFNSVCIGSCGGTLLPLINGYIAAADNFIAASNGYFSAINAPASSFEDADIFDIYSRKCSALIDNVDMLPAWCDYKATAQKLNENGLTFMTDAMESGKISGKQVLAAFRKNVYRNFVQTNIPSDPDLAAFSASVMDENAAAFSRLLEEFSALTREKIRADLISRLPSGDTEGPLALELIKFQRQIKGNLRSLNLRSLFTEIPELMKVVAPCVLMSPITVSQYLPPECGLFDVVIFDEASQMPTCEAVPSLARAKSAVIVGDPKQLPPTSFFTVGTQEEEPAETEDLESVLDDCLALGVPEKHLLWHYRSKHESLIAFSNINYYSSRLCTFPSPDALDSKVSLKYIEKGVYERGGAKCNRLEAEALVNEIVERLSNPQKRNSSIGVVTFSTPQQIYLEKLLQREISKRGLEDAAYDRDEPLFIKNLENVQGDERDVILFSVCYGPDAAGKISLNFGPLNQLGGWRRLNVAVTRAREEMVVFSSMRYSMIDMSRTTSRGVAGLKAFLEFAEKGRANISQNSEEVIINRRGIGKYIAEELQNYGYDCRCDVGVSDFKIDVAVLDPQNKRNFLLAVLCDGADKFSVKDRTVVQVQTLKRNNWNVIRLYAVNFFNNPKREIKKIKDFLDKLTQTDGKPASLNFKRPYRTAKIEAEPAEAQDILSGSRDADLTRVIKAVVSAEEPISTQFLLKRALSFFGITKYGVKLESKLRSAIDACDFHWCEVCGNVYYYRTERALSFDRFRTDDGGLRSQDCDYTPFDVISLIKSVLLNKVSVYQDELIPTVLKELKVPRATEKLNSFVLSCIDEGVRRGLLIKSVSDKISLA